MVYERDKQVWTSFIKEAMVFRQRISVRFPRKF
jgi:hypothetical protein